MERADWYIFYSLDGSSVLRWIDSPLSREAREGLARRGFFLKSKFPYIYLVGRPGDIHVTLDDYVLVESLVPLSVLEVVQQMYRQERPLQTFPGYIDLLINERILYREGDSLRFLHNNQTGAIFYVEHLEPNYVLETEPGFWDIFTQEDLEEYEALERELKEDETLE